MPPLSIPLNRELLHQPRQRHVRILLPVHVNPGDKMASGIGQVV